MNLQHYTVPCCIDLCTKLMHPFIEWEAVTQKTHKTDDTNPIPQTHTCCHESHHTTI